MVRQTLRDRGMKQVPAGARRTTREHPAGLTRREHEVLELVCDGLTNDEIASRLVLSVKTVDHHVSAVLGQARRVLAPGGRGRCPEPRPGRRPNIGPNIGNARTQSG